MDLPDIDWPDIDWPEIDLPKILSRFDAMTGALVVWGAMLSVILLFLLVAAVTSWLGWRRQNRADAAAAAAPEHLIMSPAERAQLRAEAAELIRQAAAMATAAKRAVVAVEETRIRAEAAHQAREAAWRAFDEAQRAYEQARSDINRAHEAGATDADRFGGPGRATVGSPVGGGLAAADGGVELDVLNRVVDQLESVTRAALASAMTDPPAGSGESIDDAATRRDMSRAALAAFRRGDLSVEQLGAVFRQATGWDPLMELHAREVELRRSAESRARRLFQAAAAAERMANHAADVAVVAAHALAEEAVEVAAEAEEARDLLNAVVHFSTALAKRKGRRRGAAGRKATAKRTTGTAKTGTAKTGTAKTGTAATATADAGPVKTPVRFPRQRATSEPTKELSNAG